MPRHVKTLISRYQTEIYCNRAWDGGGSVLIGCFCISHKTFPQVIKFNTKDIDFKEN